MNKEDSGMRDIIEQLQDCPISDGHRMVPTNLFARIVAELQKFEDYVEIPYVDLAYPDAAKLLFGQAPTKESDNAAK